MSRKIYVARRYEQEKNDRIVDERLQGLEYPEKMRDIKESSLALLMQVPLHDFDKKKQQRHNFNTGWREIQPRSGNSRVRKKVRGKHLR